MPVEFGMHRNGEHCAKLRIYELGISATIEGCGTSKDAATADLVNKARQLADMADDAYQSILSIPSTGDR